MIGSEIASAVMLKSLILSALFSLVFSSPIFDRNYTKPYLLKKTWVQNFIKFQYIFEGKNGKAKIVPLGCVPSNLDNGHMLKIGEHHIGHDFVFSCEEGEDGVLSYEAIACVDAFGVEMQIGETRRLSNGTVVLHCNMFGGALKKVVERAAGCYFNETIYGEDRQWIEPIRLETEKKTDAIGSYLTGKLMQCFRPHYSYYESHIIGCVVGRMGIRIDEFAELYDGTFVKCIETELGTITLKEVDVRELSCTVDNDTFAHNSKWNDTERAAEMHCNFGHIIKNSCLLDNQLLPIGQEVKVSNNCVFLCHPQTNVYICDQKLANFSMITDEESKNDIMKKFLL